MPIRAAPLRDPRTIITPDAFEVSRELLGLPLGTWIGIITVIVWMAVGVGGNLDGGREDEPSVEISTDGSSASATGLTGLLSLAQGIGEARLVDQAVSAALVDELGFGFGWASLYLTVMLSWWKGQTIGKRVMKIRVLRLDGEPITWWAAFERAGGYAAGIATGLLGFAQVFWDSNRQGIHDRIAGPVVVIDGAEKVLDWEKVL